MAVTAIRPDYIWYLVMLTDAEFSRRSTSEPGQLMKPSAQFALSCFNCPELPSNSGGNFAWPNGLIFGAR